MKTYTLPHNHQLNHFLRAYLTMLNLMIDDIWNHIQWREKQVRGKKQKRLLPTIPTYTFRKKNEGKIPGGVELRPTLGGLSNKNSILHHKLLEKKLQKRKKKKEKTRSQTPLRKG